MHIDKLLMGDTWTAKFIGSSDRMEFLFHGESVRTTIFGIRRMSLSKLRRLNHIDSTRSP